jgi:dolichyl-phosphate beta-glucosyltransferase
VPAPAAEVASSPGTGCRLSVVLPAYNESRLILSRLERLRRHLDRGGGSWEIIVVDDGSRDETADRVASWAGKEPRVRLVRLPRNSGKGAAVARGVIESSGEIVATTDADLSYALADMDTAAAAVGAGADIATGNRDHPSSRINLPFELFPYLVRRWIAGAAFRWLVRILFGLRVTDTQCGLKAYSRRAADLIMPKLRTSRFLADIEVLLAARELELRLVEVPVHLRYLSSDSSVRILSDLPGALRDLAKIKLADVRGLYR